jgi:hypothetical protein
MSARRRFSGCDHRGEKSLMTRIEAAVRQMRAGSGLQFRLLNGQWMTCAPPRRDGSERDEVLARGDHSSANVRSPIVADQQVSGSALPYVAGRGCATSRACASAPRASGPASSTSQDLYAPAALGIEIQNTLVDIQPGSIGKRRRLLESIRIQNQYHVL